MCVLKLFGICIYLEGQFWGLYLFMRLGLGLHFLCHHTGWRKLQKWGQDVSAGNSMQSGMDGEGRRRGGGGGDSLRNNQRSMNLDLLSRASRSYKQCLLIWKTQHIDTYTDFIGKCVLPRFPCGGTVGELNTCCRYIL